MRKVYSALFMSLDGTVESPEKWQFDQFDGDMAQAHRFADNRERRRPSDLRT